MPACSTPISSRSSRLSLRRAGGLSGTLPGKRYDACAHVVLPLAHSPPVWKNGRAQELRGKFLKLFDHPVGPKRSVLTRRGSYPSSTSKPAADSTSALG